MTYPQGQPPMPYYGGAAAVPPDALLGPARSAGLLMIIVGVLLLLGGVCIAGLGVAVSQVPALWVEMIPAMREAGGEQFEGLADAELVSFVQITMFVLAGLIGVMSVLWMIFGAVVRGGGKGVVLTGIVLNIVGTLLLVLISIGSLPVSLVVFGIPLVLVVIATVLLFRAVGNADQLRQARAAWQGYGRQPGQYPPQYAAQYPSQYPPQYPPGYPPRQQPPYSGPPQP